MVYAMKRALIVAVFLGVAFSVPLIYRYAPTARDFLYVRLRGRRTVQEVVREYGPTAEARLKPYFDRAGISYPPYRIALLAFKLEKELELWARLEGAWTYIRKYPILAASGKAGPKLREGDRQVPEGIYRVVSFNPNSAYHLSIKLDYPNVFDLQKARLEGRVNPGSDIFIHGGARSIGCLAVGEAAIEELFVIAARVGSDNVEILIAPNDLRCGPPVTDLTAQPSWVGLLYESVAAELRRFMHPANASAGR